MDNQSQRMLVQNMYKRQVTAGEILVDQGSTGLAATQLYVIESGSFEIHHPEESNDFSTSAITAEHHAGVSNQPRDQIGSSDCEAPSEFGKSTLPGGRDVFQSRWPLSMRPAPSLPPCWQLKVTWCDNCDVQPASPGLLSHALQGLTHGLAVSTLGASEADLLHCGHELHQLPPELEGRGHAAPTEGNVGAGMAH
ncbi:hypothetical protein QJQ45_028553 [Haematococcus lacustris]|nr:hypothetical protein QJQ45_028553 [Haematococcus lacustris]